MSEKTTAGLENSGTDVQLSQALSHLQIQSATDGNPACQVCGEAITEGQSVTIYLSRAAGRAGYRIGQRRCGNHNEDLTTLFTLGVRELIVDGRIGQCRDPTTEETWPVLLTPSIRLISAGDTKSGRCPTDHPRRPPHAGDHQSTPTPNGDPPAQATGIGSATQPLDRMLVVVEKTDTPEMVTRSRCEQPPTETTEDDH